MIGTTTLCVDLDSTIWDTGAWVCAAVLEVTGEELDVEEVTTWTHVLDTYGEETTTLVFDRRRYARCETTSTSEYTS